MELGLDLTGLDYHWCIRFNKFHSRDKIIPVAKLSKILEIHFGFESSALLEFALDYNLVFPIKNDNLTLKPTRKTQDYLDHIGMIATFIFESKCWVYFAEQNYLVIVFIKILKEKQFLWNSKFK